VSTAVAERLDSLVTKDPPPCEAFITKTQEFCGRPSAYRLYRECECGLKSTRHVCEPCYFDLMLGMVHCSHCLNPVTSWVLA
jgi:hypothetical protein